MRRALLVILVGALVAAGVSQSSAQEAPIVPVQTITTPAPLRHGCAALYSRREFRAYTTRVYRRGKVTSAARDRVATMLLCQETARSERWAKAKRRALQAARRVFVAWRWIKAHPMPYCTWAFESGVGPPEYAPRRYRARNDHSTAGGKYQIIDGTWARHGGRPYRDSHPAAVAPPLEQEFVARRVMASSGPGAWNRC